ncbi:CDP-alcohol phosphatidyltransferase family protein [Oxyplasma meridianum]|uniref:CDP-alcohol phosphatidyltransferase family protein n=1 Tax=Oxyplasma meridianum TaxID=3073602 RepID=A0AAX4NF89_9ARCH
MVLDSYRSKVDGTLTLMASPFVKMNPNSISLFSLILAALAGIFYYIGSYFLLFSFIFIALSSLFDALDGKVARMRNLQSRRGDLLDHVFDRYSDIFIMLGMVFSAYGDMKIGILAIIGIMLTSYMGTQSQALGLGRNYSGILGRADRLVFMLVFTLIQFFIPGSIMFSGIRITVTVILLIWFAIAGNYTAIKRFLDAYGSV